MKLEIATPSSEQMMKDADNAYETAGILIIDSPDMMEIAADELKSIKARINELDTLRKSITKPIDEAKKKIMDLFKPPIARLESAEKTIKSAMLGYQREQKRIADEQRRQAEIAAQKERDRLRAEAEKVKAEGNEQQAAVLQATSEVITAPVITAPEQKVSGISTKSTWSAEVTELMALVQYVAQHPEHIGLIEANMKALNGMAKALKGTLSIPGVKAVETESIAARKAA